MKKINKTILLASTLFVSTTIVGADKTYASESYDINVEPLGSENLEAENLEVEDREEPISEIEATSTYTVEQSPQVNTPDLASPVANDTSSVANEEAEEEAEKEELNLVLYDDRNLDDILKQGQEEAEESSSYREESQEVTAEAKEEADYEEADHEIEETSIDHEIYYAPQATGVIVNEGDSLRYYENNKLVKNAQVIVGNKFYNIDNQGKATNPKGLWASMNSDVYYVNENGNVTRGISEIKDKKYYFNDQGVLQRNKRIVTAESYYDINNRGEMTTPKNTWVSLAGNVYYSNNDGKLSKGITTINNKTYYFDNDGIQVRGKKILTDTRYFIIDEKGVVSNPKNQWLNIGEGVYRSDEKGLLLTGLRTISGKQYLFNKEGKLFTNQKLISAGKFYDIDASGGISIPKNQWVEIDGKKYHTNGEGYVKEGVWNIDNVNYYFTANGLTPNQTITQQGIMYQVDENGIAKAIDAAIPGEKSIDKLMEWMFNARAAKMTYNMGAGRNTASQADCSSAVYRALIYGGFLKPDTWVGNTETLFQMGAKGSVMYEIKENEIQHGDIFVAGRPGGSMGAAGHTGFILNPTDDTIIHMSYGKNGVAVTPRKGYMGDGQGLPVKYFRLVGANTSNTYLNKK